MGKLEGKIENKASSALYSVNVRTLTSPRPAGMLTAAGRNGSRRKKNTRLSLAGCWNHDSSGRGASRSGRRSGGADPGIGAPVARERVEHEAARRCT